MAWLFKNSMVLVCIKFPLASQWLLWLGRRATLACSVVPSNSMGGLLTIFDELKGLLHRGL